jgi:hypothetical protein
MSCAITGAVNVSKINRLHIDLCKPLFMGSDFGYGYGYSKVH